MRYFAQKLVQLLIVAVAVTLTVSLALGAIPNSKDRIAIAAGGAATTPEGRAELLDSLHLNDSAIKQYGYFVKDLVTADWGTTFQGNQSIRTSVWDGLQVSIRLMIYAQIVALAIALFAAMTAAYRQGGFFDRISTTVSFGLLSMPGYILAPILLLLFAVRWKIFPTQSQAVPFFDSPLEHFKNFFLPTIVLALPLAATYMRLLRADLVNTLQSDFITTARAKGVGTLRIMTVHALRPSLFSLLTAAAIQVGTLVGGSVIVETAFGLNGLGRKTVIGIFANEFRLVQVTVAILALVYIIINFLVDLAYGWLDPRVRASTAIGGK